MHRINTDKALRLDEFEVPSHDDWMAQVDRELGSRTLDDLRWQPDEGIDLPPVFTSRDLEGLPHLATGVANLLTPTGPWKIRQRIDAPTPEMAARQCRQALEGGADELLIRLDRLARHGVDPGILADSDDIAEKVQSEPGEGGCAIYHLGALEQVLADVDLSQTRVAFDAGAGSFAVHDMLRVIAKKRGHSGKLNVELGLDPMGELARGPSNSPVIPELMGWLGAEDATPLAIHSIGYHRAGASAAQELACTIATGIWYLQFLTDPPPHMLFPELDVALPIDTAVRSIGLRMTVNTDIYVEIAKLRAVRLLWAKVAHAFGATDLRVTLNAESSDRSWSGDDVHTNLLRSNLQAFIASLSGCDSITISPFDTTHDEQAHALARNQLILLREESMMQRVQDPCGGSYTIESLTDRLARNAWSLVQEIQSHGGMYAALDGFVQSQIAASGTRRRQNLETRSRTLVGINRFADPKYRKGELTLPDSESIRRAHTEYLANRGPMDVQLGLDVQDGVNAATDGATLGEMTLASRMRNLIDSQDRFLCQSPEGMGFETLRSMVVERKFAVQPILVGDLKLARAREAFARDIFTVGGFDVLESITAGDGVTHNTPVVVMCGEDALVDDLAQELDGNFELCVAGAPRPDIEATFLFRGCNALRALRGLYLSLTEEQDGPEGDA